MKLNSIGIDLVASILLTVLPVLGVGWITHDLVQVEVFAPLAEFQRKLAFMAGAFLVLIFVVALVMARHIARPTAGLNSVPGSGTRVAVRIAALFAA